MITHRKVKVNTKIGITLEILVNLIIKHKLTMNPNILIEEITHQTRVILMIKIDQIQCIYHKEGMVWIMECIEVHVIILMIADTHTGVVYQYRYPQYRNTNIRQFWGSRCRQGSNRSQQRLQNDYNYEANVRLQHFNDYMRQNDEYNEKYDDTTEYKGQILQADFWCAQCREYGHYIHQCEDAWTQVMDLCDCLGQTSLKEEVYKI